MIRSFVLCGFCCVAVVCAVGQTHSSDPLSCFFDGKYGQVEVGGRFAGAEFHRSHPLPSRISFYYPVANSIDVSTDYWKREDSQPMVVGIQTNDGPKHWLGKEPWAYTLSPHKVKFDMEEAGVKYSMSYEFCLNEPAMAFTMKITNTSAKPATISAYTHLRLSLRTCQTFARKDSALTEFDASTNAVLAHFDDLDTQQATCFVQNVGATPAQWTTSSNEIVVSDSGSSSWITSSARLQEKTFPSGRKGVPVAAFVYKQTLQPNDSLQVVQIIGSCRKSQVNEKLRHLKTSWRNEIAAYDSFIHRKAQTEASFMTGDTWLDRSATWARALLTTNAHYIDGHIVPMPCPAEYNFFFTHDVLMTNLAAVNFDLPRVKKDLLYVASLAKDGIIPHAYYWRDDGFKTEYCTPDNWNHLWFILVSASYLRHSMDDSTATVLYPLVKKSLEEILKQKKDDNLMYAFRPDWWDIGHIEGPRSYITILTIRALRDVAFMSATLKKDSNLAEYERLADAMQTALQEKLWDTNAKYLMNWNGETKDTHFYMGSLLAPAFGLLSDDKAGELVATATKELVAPGIGVRAAMPADFHTRESIAFFKFAGDEAGQPYYYINGGVWPHNNAWYALALKNVGRVDDGVQFVKTTMTLDGVTRSPMGIPAMYEYRYSDPSSREFGKIDKPSFLWAGGFYLYTLYQLFGVKENEWNVSFVGPLPALSESATYSLAFGKLKNVSVSGKGKYLQSCVIDGKAVPSFVLPMDAQAATKVDVKFGNPATPYLENVNVRLLSAGFDQKQKSLKFVVSSFRGHKTIAIVVGPVAPQRVLIDGDVHSDAKAQTEADGVKSTQIVFVGSGKQQTIEVRF